jgi:hypothetical protein
VRRHCRAIRHDRLRRYLPVRRRQQPSHTGELAPLRQQSLRPYPTRPSVSNSPHPPGNAQEVGIDQPG